MSNNSLGRYGPSNNVLLVSGVKGDSEYQRKEPPCMESEENGQRN